MPNADGRTNDNTPPDIEILAERVSRLEQENQAAKRILLLAACLIGFGFVLLGTVLFVGQKYDSVTERIAAKELIVIDRQNRPVIALADMADKPTLLFYDKKENARALFTLTEDGSPKLSFLDENRNSRSVLGLNRNGNPGIEFFDNTGRLRTRFGIMDLSNETVAALALLGAQGEGGSNAVLVSSGKEGAILELTDHKGVTRFFP